VDIIKRAKFQVNRFRPKMTLLGWLCTSPLQVYPLKCYVQC